MCTGVGTMTRELLIFRHGKSDWTTDAPTDFDRPLATRGRKAVRRMGHWLKDQNLIPDYVVSSPAKRARQTAKRVIRFAELPGDSIHWDDRIYDADIEALLAVLAECPKNARRAMLIGHNPGLEDLVHHLTGGAAGEPPRNGPFMPTAAVAHLRTRNMWQNLKVGCAKFVSITRPRELEGSD